MRSIRNYFFLGLLCSGLLACEKKEEPKLSAPSNPIPSLLESPESLVIGNYTLAIQSDIWRNYMPPIDSTGSNLFAAVVISETQQKVLANKLTLEKVYLINQEELWSKTFDSRDSSSPYQISGSVNNGPKWGPNIKIDLVCEFSFQGEKFRLLAKDQDIYATY